MRLLNTTDLSFEEFFESEVPKYAILSHRWISGQEISYEDFMNDRKEDKSGSVKSGWEKITWFARLAKDEYDCEWCWVDTCCIDKKSSAELSEAINSMFSWYSRSAICIAYLFDVNENIPDRTLERSQWFKRGWTLQELLAPRECHFYAGNRAFLGDRLSLDNRISHITGISVGYLHYDIHTEQPSSLDASVAEKLSWASCRETTRAEDTAYCLLGLLEVNMPLLYGEGHRAFMRLQTEFIRASPDESIFAWLPGENHQSIPDGYGLPAIPMLATSPAAFSRSGKIYVEPHLDRWVKRSIINRPPYYMTHKGLHIQVPSPCDTVKDNPAYALLQLDCYYKGELGTKRAYWYDGRYERRNYVFLLMYRTTQNLWVRVGLPYYIVSRRSRHGSFPPKADFKDLQTVLVENPELSLQYLSVTATNITRDSQRMPLDVQIDPGKAPTLITLGLAVTQRLSRDRSKI